MTGFPIVMTKANVVDYTSPFHFDDSVVLTRFDQSWTRANFNELKTVDMPTWSLFTTFFLTITSLIIMQDKSFLIKKERIFQRVSSVIFSLFGTFLEKGKHAQLLILLIIINFC